MPYFLSSYLRFNTYPQEQFQFPLHLNLCPYIGFEYNWDFPNGDDPQEMEELLKNSEDKLSIRHKSARTKCTETYFISEKLVESDWDLSDNSEDGGIQPMGSYTKKKKTLSKHLSQATGEPSNLFLAPHDEDGKVDTLEDGDEDLSQKLENSRKSQFRRKKNKLTKSFEVD